MGMFATRSRTHLVRWVHRTPGIAESWEPCSTVNMCIWALSGHSSLLVPTQQTKWKEVKVIY